MVNLMNYLLVNLVVLVLIQNIEHFFNNLVNMFVNVLVACLQFKENLQFLSIDHPITV